MHCRADHSRAIIHHPQAHPGGLLAIRRQALAIILHRQKNLAVHAGKPQVDAAGRTVAVLYVGVKKEEFFRSFAQLFVTAVGVALLMASIFAVIIWYSAGRLLGRLTALATAADAVSVGEGLDTPLAVGSQDEVGELAKAVDRLRESMRLALRRLEAAA